MQAKHALSDGATSSENVFVDLLTCCTRILFKIFLLKEIDGGGKE